MAEQGIDKEDYKPSALSYSGMTTFMQCPRRWKFNYVDKIEVEGSYYATTLGTFVHMVLEHFYQVDPERRTAGTIREMCTDLFKWFKQDEDEGYIALGLTEEEEKQFKQDAWKYVCAIWEIENPSEVEVVSTELRFLTELNGVPFRGAIDRIESLNGGLVVSDYKTGKAPKPWFAKSREEKITQILLYAAAVKEVLDVTPKRARLIFLGTEQINVVPTQDAMDKETALLRMQWDRIHLSLKNEDFKPDTGPLCGWCPYIALCPEGLDHVDRLERTGKIKPHAPALQILHAIQDL